MPIMPTEDGDFEAVLFLPTAPERPYNVNAGWISAQSYSTAAFDNAMSFLNDIGTISQQIGALPDITADIGEVTGTLTPITIPAVPVRPEGLVVNLPQAPTEPTLLDVAPLDAGTAPEFSATPADVDLSIAPPV